MVERKWKIIIDNKEYDAEPVSYQRATTIHNQLHREGFPMHSHDLKSNDSFRVKDEKVRLISFYGHEPQFVVYADGTKVYSPKADFSYGESKSQTKLFCSVVKKMIEDEKKAPDDYEEIIRLSPDKDFKMELAEIQKDEIRHYDTLMKKYEKMCKDEKEITEKEAEAIFMEESGFWGEPEIKKPYTKDGKKYPYVRS